MASTGAGRLNQSTFRREREEEEQETTSVR